MPSSFNAELNVKLNPQSLNSSTKQVQQALGRITGQASEFQKSLDASTARVFAFGATTAVLNGVTQSFKKLVSTTIEVEKRLIEINSIFQATDATFNRFRNSIFQVAKDTGQAFGTVADGAAELARQGLNAEETAKRLKASLVLTRISGLDAEKSVKALTAAINGFASAGLSANQIVNKLVAVDTAFAVSAQDLAEAFSRAGSTAEDAGVSFDQLLGLITAVEQKTARGGAVIGNAFKSIFTRLSRGTTIEELKELGVAIDASQTGIQKLMALSSALDNISDPTVASKIKELAGGVFQINVVSAALKDLGSNTSIFKNAAITAASATNEAFEKNAELNKSISAQINVLIQGLTSLSEKIGSITFGPLLENLVGIATKFTEFLDKALDPEKGNIFIKGFFKTIGSFLSGPAIVLFTGAFVKIAGLIAKFAAEGMKSLFAMGTQAERIKNIESGIVGLLSRDKSLRTIIASTTATQAQKEQAIITAIQRENQLLRDQATLRRSLATTAFGAGVRGFNDNTGLFSRRRGKPFAKGGRVTGGSGTKDDVPAMLTAGEFVMRKSAVDKFGLGFMRQVNNGAIGMSNGGFVPNYSRIPPLSDLMKKREGKRFREREQAGSLTDDDKQVLANIEIQKGKAKAQQAKRLFINPRGSAILVPNIGFKKNLKAGTRGNFKQGKNNFPFEFTEKVRIRGPQVPRAVDQAANPQDEKLKRSITRGVSTSAANYAGLLRPTLGKPAPSQVLRNMKVQGGGKGALNAIVGAAFEAAVSVGLGVSPAKNTEGGDFDIKNQSATVMNDTRTLFGLPDNVNLMDFKVSSSLGNIASFAKKLKNQGRASGGMKMGGLVPNYAGGPVPSSMIRVHKDPISGTPLAVTNTRDEPRGLKDAIKREKAGIGMTMGGLVPNYAEEAPRSRLGGGGAIMGLFAIQGILQTFSAGMEQSTTATEADTEATEERIKATEKDFAKRQKLLNNLEKNSAEVQESTSAFAGFVSAMNIATTALITLSTISELGGGNLIGRVAKTGVGAKLAGAGAGAGRFFKGTTAKDLALRQQITDKARAKGGGGFDDVGKFEKKMDAKFRMRGMVRAGGAIGGLFAAGSAIKSLTDDELTGKQKGKEISGAGGALAGGLAGAKAGAMLGLVGGPAAPVTSAIGAVVGGIAGAAFGAFGAESIFDGLVGNPEDDIQKALEDASAKVLSRSFEAAQMDEGTFNQLANENLTRIAETGGDAGAVEQAYRDAVKKSVEIEKNKALGIENSGEEMVKADIALRDSIRNLLGVVSLNAKVREQHAREIEFTEAGIIQANKDLKRATAARAQAIDKARDTAATLLSGAQSASAIAGTVGGPFGGAVQTAAGIGLQRANIVSAQTEMDLARAEMQTSGSPEEFAENKKIFDEAAKNFREQVRKAGESLINNIDKTEKAFDKIGKQIVDSLKAEKAARVADAKTTLGQEMDPERLKLELESIKQSIQEGDIGAFEQKARDFSGQGLGSLEQIFTAEFGEVLGNKLQDAILQTREDKLNLGGQGSLNEDFLKNLNKEKGIDRSAERDELKEERRDLAKQIELLEKEYKRMQEETSTATITGELKRMKAAMDGAAESFEGVDAFVKEQSDAATKASELVEKNAKFVIEQSSLMDSAIDRIKELQAELNRLLTK